MADAIEKYLLVLHSHLQYCLFIQVIQVIHISKCGCGYGPSTLWQQISKREEPYLWPL